MRNFLTVIPNFSSFMSRLVGYVTVSSLEQEFGSCNLVTPPYSSSGCDVKMENYCRLSPVTCCRVCNASMGPMSWGNIPDPQPSFDMHQLRLWNNMPVLSHKTSETFYNTNWTGFHTPRDESNQI